MLNERRVVISTLDGHRRYYNMTPQAADELSRNFQNSRTEFLVVIDDKTHSKLSIPRAALAGLEIVFPYEEEV